MPPSAPPDYHLRISLPFGHHLHAARLPPLHLPAVRPPLPPTVKQGRLWEADEIRLLESWIDGSNPTRL
ncbi:hypothetical protein GUJ93_ZPchr0006g43113 [Zizania palustris]|uniref:Uncharacterized protein n=1 Tax=Zizania palustris TaxID=103762 RepID=A0A8J5TAZ4_ZIZPA|nr:hypothetical protein GUJ93_ZPchr0006g43113 [Zizania palustris]